MRAMVKVFPGVMSAIVLAACGSPESTSAGNTDASVVSAGDSASGATDADTAVPVTPGVEETPLNIVTQVSDQGKTIPTPLSGVIERPIACTASAKCPLAVIIGDRASNAFPNYKTGAKALAANSGAIVVVFNLPGTGEGGNKSAGIDDIGGNWHISAVKDVMHLLSARSDVDKKRVGFITIGTGLIPVASAMKKFGNGDLKDIRFLIDVEGPVDRCAISEAPEDVAHLIGPSDGPGATNSACHFDDKLPHELQYPAAKDGNPTSIVCAEGAWPITATGKNCAQDNMWWIEREPLVNLKSMNAALRYWRLQFKYDHRLPSHASSALAMKAIGGSLVKWSALNWQAPCGAIPSEADCLAGGCWLDGGYGNGLAPAPYSSGKLKAISLDALLGQVLPEHVITILDVENVKDCK